MESTHCRFLAFESQRIEAHIRGAGGEPITRPIELRINPVTGRRSRITFSRSLEGEPATQVLPSPPPDAQGGENCPFCPGHIDGATPRLIKGIDDRGRLHRGESVLFPNLYPYGAYSAVSLFDGQHFVEIGTADAGTYADSFINCAAYLKRVAAYDEQAVFMAITQNHLPAAGGSLVHPHLQVHADRIPSNHHDFLNRRAKEHWEKCGSGLLGDYLAAERIHSSRLIGSTGRWHWLAAFAPEGFFEIWAILPGETSLFSLDDGDWQNLATGVINTQRFYRSLCRNSYNLGLLTQERPDGCLELRVVLTVRANYAPWVRSDMTGYEIMLGDMATFNAPEETAEKARPFWQIS